MYTTKIHTGKFDLNSPEELQKYNAVIANPDNTVIREIREKLVDKEFGGEGQMTMIIERLIAFVTWQERTLVE